MHDHCRLSYRSNDSQGPIELFPSILIIISLLIMSLRKIRKDRPCALAADTGRILQLGRSTWCVPRSSCSLPVRPAYILRLLVILVLTSVVHRVLQAQYSCYSAPTVSRTWRTWGRCVSEVHRALGTDVLHAGLKPEVHPPRPRAPGKQMSLCPSSYP